jgi:hypothetical protein
LSKRVSTSQHWYFFSFDFKRILTSQLDAPNGLIDVWQFLKQPGLQHRCVGRTRSRPLNILIRGKHMNPGVFAVTDNGHIGGFAFGFDPHSIRPPHRNSCRHFDSIVESPAFHIDNCNGVNPIAVIALHRQGGLLD